VKRSSELFPVSQNFDKSLIPTILIALIAGAVIDVLLNSASLVTIDPGFISFLSLLIIMVTLSLIIISFTRIPINTWLDITRPLTFYGIFYFLYYLLPFMLLYFSGQLPMDNGFTIALSFLLGYLAWYAGIKGSRVCKAEGPTRSYLGKPEAIVLLFLCIVGICLVGYTYLWRVSTGIFYNQARYYEQELTVAASIRDVFIMGLQLPIILFLGLLSGVEDKRLARISRCVFLSYSVAILMILILSSQARPAITALIFILIGVKMYRSDFIKLYKLVLVGLLGIVAILILQGVRVASNLEFASADNQLYYAVQHTIPNGVSGINYSGSDVVRKTINRAGASITFLSEIMNSMNGNTSYLYGDGLLSSLYSLIPRILWKDKPIVEPQQLVVKKLLHSVPTDAPMSPVVEFYVHGGWFGIIAGYFVFGWLMGKLTNRTLHSPGIGVFMVLAFVWSQVVQLEQELILGILTTLRNAAIIYIIYRVLLFAVQKASPSIGRLPVGNKG